MKKLINDLSKRAFSEMTGLRSDTGVAEIYSSFSFKMLQDLHLGFFNMHK